MLRNFSYVIEGELAGSAFPGGWESLRDDIEEIIAKGFKAIVTLTEEPLPPGLLKEHSIDYLHLPIPDFHPPTINQIFKFVNFIDKCRKGKKPVLVHCWAGIGRTGTILSAYFVSKGMSTQEAIRHIRKLRIGSIETDEQIERVCEFERILKSKTNSGDS